MKFLVGVYNDDEKLVEAVKKIRGNGVHIHDVVSPFAVHGLDDALGLKESRLHIAGFIYGITGTTIALSFMSWVFAVDWPLNFGGKPHFPFPAFIPITFEFTVLCASIGMTLTWLIRCGLYPGRLRESLDPRFTDDRFGIIFKVKEQTDVNKLTGLLKETGAEEVKEKDLKQYY